MELASLLKVTFGLVFLVSQSLTQQALQRHVRKPRKKEKIMQAPTFLLLS